MDSNAQLALMTKAKLVFEDAADLFLSFPALTPISYTPDQLNLPGIPSTVLQSQMLQEFARLVNTIPQGALFDPTSSDLLWNVYGNVLGVFDGGGDAVQLAQADLTVQQNADFQQAESFLYTQTADGQQTASPAYVAYNQYQTAWTQATQNYKTQQISALASNDPAVQTQWQNTDEPNLRALVQSALDDWTNKGSKAAVENALQVVASASAQQSPQVIWNGWKASFQPGIDFLTDSNTNTTYALTAFSPSNAASQTNWPTFTLSGPEIGQLVSQAPKELVNIFGTAAGTSNVASLSFEFCSVALNRSWFKPELFGAKFWRFADASLQLSDGSNPSQGRLPAYVKGLVFVRNIVVTPAAVAGNTGPAQVQNLPTVSQFVNVQRFLIRPAAPAVSRVMPPPTAPTRPVMLAARVAEPPLVEPRFAMAATALRVPQPPLAQPALALRVQAISYTALPSPQVAPTVNPATPPPSNTVSILAFICQRVPKSPNPDPSLTW